MAVELWKLPVPASALLSGPNFAVLPPRRCEISFQFEGEHGEKRQALIFEAVEAYRATYLSSMDTNLINVAYGRLVDLGESTWLLEVRQRSAAYYTKLKQPPPHLRHMAICFDDGPAFEIIGSGYTVS
jgi:hypothetical protein